MTSTSVTYTVCLMKTTICVQCPDQMSVACCPLLYCDNHFFCFSISELWWVVFVHKPDTELQRLIYTKSFNYSQKKDDCDLSLMFWSQQSDQCTHRWFQIFKVRWTHRNITLHCTLSLERRGQLINISDKEQHVWATFYTVSDPYKPFFYCSLYCYYYGERGFTG